MKKINTHRKNIDRLYILIMFFLWTSIKAGEYFDWSYKYENVTIIGINHQYSEDINQKLISGKYVKIFLDKINYIGNVTIFFDTPQLMNDQSKGNTFKLLEKEPTLAYKSFSGLLIEIIDEETAYQPRKLLSYVNYAVKYKKHQSQKFPNHFDSRLFYDEILGQRVNRPEIFDDLKVDGVISYFYQNEKFHIFSSDIYTHTQPYTLEMIRQFSASSIDAFIFTSSEDFMIVNERGIDKNWHIVKNKISRPINMTGIYRFNYLTPNILSIKCSYSAFECYRSPAIFWREENKIVHSINQVLENEECFKSLAK